MRVEYREDSPTLELVCAEKKSRSSGGYKNERSK